MYGYLGFFRMLFVVVSLVVYAQSASMHGRGPEMNEQRHQQRRSAPNASPYYTEAPKYYTEPPKYYTEAPKYYTEAPQYYTTPAPTYVRLF